MSTTVVETYHKNNKSRIHHHHHHRETPDGGVNDLHHEMNTMTTTATPSSQHVNNNNNNNNNNNDNTNTPNTNSNNIISSSQNSSNNATPSPMMANHHPTQASSSSNSINNNDVQQNIINNNKTNNKNNNSDENNNSNNSLSTSCLQWLYKEIFLETLSQDDSFETVMRKMIVCGHFIAAPMLFAFGGYWLALAIIRSDQPTFPALLVPAIITLTAPFMVFYMYFSMRSTKRNAHFYATTLIFVAIFYAGIMCVCIPHFPAPTMLMAAAEASVLTRSEWFTIHMVLCVVLYIISSYNVTFINFGQWTLLAVPDPHRGSAVEKLLLTFAGWCVLMIMTAALYLQYVEYLRLVNKSSSTSQMGWTVAGHLRKWDLAAVEKTLQRYQSLPHADEVVLNQFTQIVQTIRDFSVYLPRDIIAGILSSGESIHNSQFRSREVAVMVVEICNFPALCDCVAAADLSKLLRMYHDTVTSALTAHEGVVVKLSGPSLVVLWGAPRPCDRRAGQACLAALHVIAAVEKELVSSFLKEGFGLSVRIGVTSGKAMVGAVGSRDRAIYSANGAIVNMATALAKLGRRIHKSAVLVSDVALKEAKDQITSLTFLNREAADICTRRVPTPAQKVHQLVGVADRRSMTVPGFGSSTRLLTDHWELDFAAQAVLRRVREARHAYDQANFADAYSIYAETLVRPVNEGDNEWPEGLKRHGVDIQMMELMAAKCKKYVESPPANFDPVVVISED